MSRLDFRRSQHLSSLSPVSRWQRDHEGSRRLSTRDAADLLVALLYGPAARCKPKVMIWRSWVLRFCIRPLTERLSSWPSWISARARSHSRLGPEGHKGLSLPEIKSGYIGDGDRRGLDSKECFQRALYRRILVQ